MKLLFKEKYSYTINNFSHFKNVGDIMDCNRCDFNSVSDGIKSDKITFHFNLLEPVLNPFTNKAKAGDLADIGLFNNVDDKYKDVVISDLIYNLKLDRNIRVKDLAELICVKVEEKPKKTRKKKTEKLEDEDE